MEFHTKKKQEKENKKLNENRKYTRSPVLNPQEMKMHFKLK